MNDQDFYAAMKKHVLTEDDLVINGYPLIQSKKQGEKNRTALFRLRLIKFDQI